MPNKYKRTVVGSVVKNRDTSKPDYIQIGTDVALKKGTYLNLESKAFQLQSVASILETGKMSPENAEKAKERINKIPDFVRFQIVLVEKSEQ